MRQNSYVSQQAVAQNQLNGCLIIGNLVVQCGHFWSGTLLVCCLYIYFCITRCLFFVNTPRQKIQCCIILQEQQNPTCPCNLLIVDLSSLSPTDEELYSQVLIALFHTLQETQWTSATKCHAQATTERQPLVMLGNSLLVIYIPQNSSLYSVQLYTDSGCSLLLRNCHGAWMQAVWWLKEEGTQRQDALGQAVENEQKLSLLF